MDKGMKKVVNLVTNYMSALCETGRVPGRVDRNIETLSGPTSTRPPILRIWTVFFDRIEAKNKVELRKAIKKRLSL